MDFGSTLMNICACFCILKLDSVNKLVGNCECKL